MMPRSAAIDPSMTAAPRHILPYAVFQQKNNRMEGNCYQQWWDFPKRVEVHASIISESHSSALPGVASPQTQWLVIVFTAVITAVVDTEPSPSSKILPNVYQISPKLFFFPTENLKKSHGKCNQLLRNAELTGKVLLFAGSSQRADIQISRTIFRQLLFITEFAFCSTHSDLPFCLGFFKKPCPCPWYFVLHVDVEVLVVGAPDVAGMRKRSSRVEQKSTCQPAKDCNLEQGKRVKLPTAIYWLYIASPCVSFTSLCASGWGRWV